MINQILLFLNYFTSVIRRKFMIIKSYQLCHKLYNFKNFLSNFTLAPLNKFSRKKQVQSRKIKKNTDLIAPIFKNIHWKFEEKI